MALDILGPIAQGLQIRQQKQDRKLSEQGLITGGIQQRLLEEQLGSLQDTRDIKSQGLQLGVDQQAQQLASGEIGLEAQQQGIETTKLRLQDEEQARQQAKQKQLLTSVASGAETAMSLETPAERESFLNARLKSLTDRSIPTGATEEAIQLGKQFGFDSPEFNSALNQSIQIANTAGVFTPAQQAQQKIDAATAVAGAKGKVEIRKEVRGRVGVQLKNLSKEASAIDSNSKKLTGLLTQIEGGNRAAVPAALVSLVKLGDPGSVVSEAEIKTALNATNPLSALIQAGIGEDVVNSIATKIDPLNPDNIKIEDLREVANSMISANVPSLQARFAEQQQLAGDNLTDAGVKSLFPKGLSDRLSGLSDLVTKEAGPRFKSEGLAASGFTEEDIATTLEQNPGVTREQVLETLGVGVK